MNNQNIVNLFLFDEI